MSQLKYRPEIDGLRALAVLPVLFFHAGFPGFSGGFVGVDIFFVISGFLITSILLKEHSEKQYSIVSFYERRARRLLPALFAVLLVTTIMAFIFMAPEDLLLYGKSLFATLALSSNIYFQETLNYFSVHAESLPLLHMWSLSVEEQFYVVFPIILSCIFFFSDRRTSGVVTLTLLLSSYAAMLVVMSEHHFPVGFYSLPTRAWELLAGAALAHAIHKLPTAGKWNEFFSVLGLGMLLFAVFTFESKASFPDASALIPVLGTVLVIGFARSSTFVGGTILTFKPFIWVGLISYSLYLWHQPVYAFTRILSNTHPGYMEFAAGTILSLALAALTYRYVETPFRNKSVWPRTRIFTLSATVGALFAVTGLSFYLLKGAPGRYLTPPSIKFVEQQHPDCVISSDKYSRPGDEKCSLNPQESVTVAVLGDSHGHALANALADQMPGTGIQQLTHSGCPPIGDYYHWDQSCIDWFPEAINYLVSSPNIETVIIQYRHTVYLYGQMGEHYPNPPSFKTLKKVDGGYHEKPTHEVYFNAFDFLIQKLVAANKKIILVTPTPELHVPLNRLALPLSIFSDGPRYDLTQTVPYSYYRMYTNLVREHLVSLSNLNPSVTVIDSGPLMCENGYCSALHNGEPAYYDTNHITKAYASPIAHRVRDLIISMGMTASSNKETPSL